MDAVRRSGWGLAALVALVFALGVATGVYASRAGQQRQLRETLQGDPAAMRARLMLPALEERLDLTSTQRAEVARLLDAQAADYRAAVEACRPQVRALRRELIRALAPSLTPAQRTRLEELIRDRPR